LFQRVVYDGSAERMDGTEVHVEPDALSVIVPVRVHIRLHLGFPVVPMLPLRLPDIPITPSLLDYRAFTRVTMRFQCSQVEETQVRLSREAVTVDRTESHVAPVEPPGLRDALDLRVRVELIRQFSESIDAKLARWHG
jgi:hypothetical protein